MQDSNDLYILLTDTGTLFSKMIKFFTKAPYNHVSIGFDHELKELYSFGRKKPYNPFVAGFVKENIRHVVFCHAKCALYRFQVDSHQRAGIYHLVKKLYHEREQYKYNLLGLMGVLLKKDFNRKKAFFCSQFIATVLAENGLQLVQKPPAFTTPADFQEVLASQIIFEGTMGELLIKNGEMDLLSAGTLPA